MAGKIYTNQPLTLTLDCKTSLAGASALAMRVLKPDGTQATWTAAASGATTMAYQVPQGALDQPGVWTIQALVTIGAETTPGESATLRMHGPFR